MYKYVKLCARIAKYKYINIQHILKHIYNASFCVCTLKKANVV